MELYGKALANQIPDSTSGNQGQAMFGAMATAIAGAYSTLSSYQWDSVKQAMVIPGGAIIYGLTPDTVGPAKNYLDSVNAAIQGYYANTFADDAQLTPDLLTQLRASASMTSVAVKTIDELYSTSWASELADSIVDAAGTVTAKIASAVAHVAGSFIGGTWWIWLCVAGGLVVYSRWKRGAL